MLDLLRFADLAPAEVYATLLDESTCHCSIPLFGLPEQPDSDQLWLNWTMHYG